jgi:uncharacterized protein YuzE
MTIEYDRDNDFLYIQLKDKEIAESGEASPGLVLDYDADGAVVGIEIEEASRRADLSDLVFGETHISIA